MQTLTLGGREIQAIEAQNNELTIEQDIFVMNAVKRSGIGPITMHEGESPEDFVDRLLTDLVLSGAFFPILAAFLVFEGEEWSVDKSQRDAMVAFLRGLREPDDKAKMRGMIATLMLGFLRGGLSSGATSQSSSAEEAEAPPQEDSASL